MYSVIEVQSTLVHCCMVLWYLSRMQHYLHAGNLTLSVENQFALSVCQGGQSENQLADGLAKGRAIWLWFAGHSAKAGWYFWHAGQFYQIGRFINQKQDRISTMLGDCAWLAFFFFGKFFFFFLATGNNSAMQCNSAWSLLQKVWTQKVVQPACSL